MDALHIAGIRFAEALQAGPPWLEKFWISLTSLADPKSIFTVCFPLAYFLDRQVGVSVLWIGLLAEWLNVVLKWFLFGERPFWWVHESGFSSRELVTLRQFPVSCETGPGSPSGHCMITGAALWPLVTALASRLPGRPALKRSPLAAYTVLLVLLGLSRVFVLAHFPHQVFGGIAAGAALGWGLRAGPPPRRGPAFFAALALGLGLGSLALHSLVVAAGIDIDWSIRLATKWCRERQWLRLDTRPFSSVCRDAGSALGLGVVAAAPPPRLRPRQRLAGAVLALATLQLLQRLLRPRAAALWYGTSFLQYAAGPWLVASLLPRLILLLTRPRDAPRAE